MSETMIGKTIGDFGTTPTVNVVKELLLNLSSNSERAVIGTQAEFEVALGILNKVPDMVLDLSGTLGEEQNKRLNSIFREYPPHVTSDVLVARVNLEIENTKGFWSTVEGIGKVAVAGIALVAAVAVGKSQGRS
ncbi:MAG: hypothetical protein ACR2HF_02725 [Methylococcaceae bacterium]